MMYSIFFSKKKLLSGIFRSLKNLNFDKFKNFFEIISFIKKNKYHNKFSIIVGYIK